MNRKVVKVKGTTLRALLLFALFDQHRLLRIEESRLAIGTEVEPFSGIKQSDTYLTY
jgi:hypothetical protein